MKFDDVIKLSQSELLKGVKVLFSNGQSHFDNGRLAGESKKYGLAVALTVLSIEELIKANALFLILTEAGNEDLFNAAFNSKNLHKTRLKLAEGLSISHGLIDKHEIVKSIEKASESIDFDFSKMSPLEILKMDWIEEFMKKFHDSPEMKQEIEKIVHKVVPEVGAKLSEHASWFLNAQSKKENGMYGDLVNGLWHSPSSVTKDDFNEAYSHASFLFDSIGRPIETLVSASPLHQEVFLKLAKESIRQAKNSVI